VACLRTGAGEIEVPEPVRLRALGCIERMLDFTAAQKLRASGMSSGLGAA
jgi:quinolinate synthase